MPCGKAAAILRRRDIQTEAGILVCDVERAIHEANPGRQGDRTELRLAHSKLSEGGYAALVAQKRAEQEPLARSEVRDRRGP